MVGKMALHMKLTKEKRDARNSSKEDQTDSEASGLGTGNELRERRAYRGRNTCTMRTLDD